MMRAFSLLEMMMVVAMLAVMAAVAVPSMAPQVDKTRLEGTAESMASFLARAQAEAMASRRCVRVTIVGKNLVSERLNAYDCDTSPTTAPKIDTTKGTWVELSRLRLDHEGVFTVGFDPVPAETAALALGNSEPDQIRFRPNGRLWSSDTDITDDDGVIKLTHNGMPSAGPARTKKVLVEAQGLICALGRGVNPRVSGTKLLCP